MWPSEDSGAVFGDTKRKRLPEEHSPGQSCESVLPPQRTKRGRFHQSDSVCNAPPLHPTSPDEIYPEPTRQLCISLSNEEKQG